MSQGIHSDYCDGDCGGCRLLELMHRAVVALEAIREKLDPEEPEVEKDPEVLAHNAMFPLFAKSGERWRVCRECGGRDTPPLCQTCGGGGREKVK